MILKPAQIDFDFVQSDVEFVQIRPEEAIPAPVSRRPDTKKSRDATSGIAGSSFGCGAGSYFSGESGSRAITR